MTISKLGLSDMMNLCPYKCESLWVCLFWSCTTLHTYPISYTTITSHFFKYFKYHKSIKFVWSNTVRSTARPCNSTFFRHLTDSDNKGCQRTRTLLLHHLYRYDSPPYLLPAEWVSQKKIMRHLLHLSHQTRTQWVKTLQVLMQKCALVRRSAWNDLWELWTEPYTYVTVLKSSEKRP